MQWSPISAKIRHMFTEIRAPKNIIIIENLKARAIFPRTLSRKYESTWVNTQLWSLRRVRNWSSVSATALEGGTNTDPAQSGIGSSGHAPLHFSVGTWSGGISSAAEPRNRQTPNRGQADFRRCCLNTTWAQNG